MRGEATATELRRDPDFQLRAAALPVDRKDVNTTTTVVAARLDERQADAVAGKPLGLGMLDLTAELSACWRTLLTEQTVQGTVILMSDQDLRDVPLGDRAELNQIITKALRWLRNLGHVGTGP